MEDILDVMIFGGVDEANALEDAILDDIMNPENQNRNLANQYGRLNLQLLSDEECVMLFRFSKADLTNLCNLLQLQPIRTPENVCASGLEGLCILLRRLAYPNRLHDLERIFGRCKSSLSTIRITLIKQLHTLIQPYLTHFGNVPWLTEDRIQSYALAISRRGAPVQNCWGFIDGTARAICRPNINQREYFSGHKRQHVVKYQSIMCPGGIITHLSGPYPGRRHDAGIFRESGLQEQLETYMRFGNAVYTSYGDPAYPLRGMLLCPYPANDIDNRHQMFNQRMSSVRQCVEWGFGKVAQEFAFVDF